MLGPGAAAAGRPGEHSSPELAARGRRPTQPFIAPGPRPQLGRVCISKRGEPRGRESKGETRRGRGFKRRQIATPSGRWTGRGLTRWGRRGASRARVEAREVEEPPEGPAAQRLARHLHLREEDRDPGLHRDPRPAAHSAVTSPRGGRDLTSNGAPVWKVVEFFIFGGQGS